MGSVAACRDHETWTGGTLKLEPIDEIDKYRKDHPLMGSSEKGASYGYFTVPVGDVVLDVISSGSFYQGNDWEHVSVSLPDRCPTWAEMCVVKDLFWKESETVIQFHPRKNSYKNYHEFCLHLWRHKSGHELPPTTQV